MPEPDLSDPKLPRLFPQLGLPAMAGLSLNAAHQVVDTFFVGKLGTEALAALVLMAPLAGLVAAAGIGLGAGSASAIARALGRETPEEARQITGLVLVIAGLLALSAVIGLVLLRGPVLDLLGAPEPVRLAASPYLLPLSLTIGLSIIQIICDFTAIGRGNARFSLRTLALCFGLNMTLDPLFIFTFGLGLPGAAWATLTAQIVTLTVWARHFRDPARRPALGPLRLLRPVIAIGLPEAGSVVMSTLGLLILFGIAGSAGNTETLAAFGIAIRLLFFMTLPLEGFFIGVQPILAHAFGAGRHERVIQSLHLLLKLGLCATCALMLTFLLFPVRLAGIFTGDPGIAGQAGQDLRWLAFALPAIAIRLCAQISLQAACRARAAAVLGLAPMGWLLLPLLMLLIPVLGPAGLPLAVTSAALLAGLLAALLLRRHLIHTDTIGAIA